MYEKTIAELEQLQQRIPSSWNPDNTYNHKHDVRLTKAHGAITEAIRELRTYERDLAANALAVSYIRDGVVSDVKSALKAAYDYLDNQQGALFA